MSREIVANGMGLNAHGRLETRTDDAFAEAEREGLMLAAKVRTLALVLIILWAAIDSTDTGLIYVYDLAEIACFAVLGLLQYFSAKQRFHMHLLKYLFVVVDCILLALILSFDNPIDPSEIPAAIALDGSRAAYFFIFLLQAAFSLRPRLVVWCGLCIVAARTGLLLWITSQPGVFTNLALPEQTMEALLEARQDPNFVFLGFWATDILVTLILAAGLAVVVRRYRRLLESQLVAERTRASLSRYFSPNVVDHLSASDQSLATVQQQDVAVLFADIMGFTELCESASPETVVALLREYHNRLGQTVFDNEGTLDKYIGDGLMATFGTPQPRSGDARNALQCATEMIAALDEWNAERLAAGEQPVRVGIGVHYGSVIAGDIGNERRLEYSVIGDTVNIASRLEQLTRILDTPLVVSDSLIKAIIKNGHDEPRLLSRLTEGDVQQIRGRDSGVAVWTFQTE